MLRLRCGAFGGEQLAELAEGAEDDDADVGLGQAHDLRDLLVRQLGVELQRDDVLLALRELPDEAGDVLQLFLLQHLALDGGRGGRDLAHHLRVDDRLAAVLAAVADDGVAGDGEEPGGEGVVAAQGVRPS